MENNITYEGELNLNGLIIPCYVLENGERVLSTAGMQKALGVIGNEPDQRSSGRLDEILSSKVVSRFISDVKDPSKYRPISCYKGKVKYMAYNAVLLPEICEIMLQVRDYAKDHNIELGSRQKLVIAQSDIIIRALARVGIIALVDEATGYQYDREKDELQKILKAYISEELLVWKKRFPDEFYREIFRLNGWGFTVPEINTTGRPGIIGKWTKKYIYSVLPKGVLQALLDKTPRNDKGKLKSHLHRHLTKEQGIDHLNKQIIITVGFMNVSDNWKQFDKIWNKKFGQQELFNNDLLEPKQQKQKVEEVEEKPSDFNNKLNTALNYNPKK